jgi:hypothetical protein
MIPVASAFLQSRLNSFNVIITCGDKRLVGPPDPSKAWEILPYYGKLFDKGDINAVFPARHGHIVGFHQQDATRVP